MLGQRENCKILKRERGGKRCFTLFSVCTDAVLHENTNTPSDLDVGAALEAEHLQPCSASIGPRQAFHHLWAADVQTLGQIQAPQGRHRQQVSEA